MDEQNACWEANKSIERLLVANGATEFRIYLTGDSNFRYGIYPEYKAHRLNTPRPRFLQAVKASLVANYGAITSDGCEADDLLSIEQLSYNAHGREESIIASIDKDLDQVVGWHYHPGIRRKGEWIREPKRYLVSPDDGRRFFYTQLLCGDTADNIKGAVGIGPAKAKKILSGCTTDVDFYEACLDHFSCEEELLQNAHCLYLLQKEGDKFVPPVDGRPETFFHSECSQTRDSQIPSEVSDIERGEN